MNVLSSSTAKSSATSSSSFAWPFFFSSSSHHKISSSNSSLINPGMSSSSEPFQNLMNTSIATAPRFTVADGILRVAANIDGYKVLNLFDANGTLLMTNSFKDSACEIQLNKLRGKSFVIATLNVNGHLVKTQKIRVGH
jgi:hypothetical protein